MWEGASAAKIAATRGYGATVDLGATGPGDAFERLHQLVEETGRTLVHPFDDPLVQAGQGTVGLELLEDAPAVETILVPAGGGGLVAGIAAAAVPAGRKVVAVEPELSTAVHDALAAGRSVPVTPTSIADGLSGPFCGENALAVAPAPRRREHPRHRARDRGRVPLPVRAREAGVRAGRRRRGGGDPGRKVVGAGRRCCLGRQRSARNRLCYPGSAMKADIHPEYVLTHVRCSCGNEFETRSTKPELHVEICSACHPFYTGKQKLLDSGGRVERFQRRLEKAGDARRG